jgi:hypothetical protein
MDWRPRHKQICKFLNVGHGGMQVRSHFHTSRQIEIETEEQSLDEDAMRFFKLFTESTFEGSRAAAKKMKKFVKRQIKHNQDFLLAHSLRVLIHSSNSEMLSWPSSPLLVLLHFVDPNMLYGNEETNRTPLRHLADLVDPSNYSTHVN